MKSVRSKRQSLAVLAVLIVASMLLGVFSVGADVLVPSVAIVETEQGEAEYSNLSDAVANVRIGGTIKLLEDVVLSNTLTIPYGKKMTLDLNGNTISQEYKQTDHYEMILVDGDLTIMDSFGGGKISYTDTNQSYHDGASNTITNRGNLTVLSGTIENLSSATVANYGYPYAIDSSMWGASAEVNTVIEGGTIICNSYSAMRMRGDSPSKAVNLTVEGGEIKGTIEVQDSGSGESAGKLTITGGNISNSGTSNVIYVFGNNTKTALEIDISGGEFTGNVTVRDSIGADFNRNFISGGTFTTDVSNFCADGFEVSDNGDGTFGVTSSSNVVATINGTGYETLGDAFAAAENNDVIVLVADVAIESAIADAQNGVYNIPAGVKLTLNLDGHTINVIDNSNGNFILFYNYGEFTIKNGTVELVATNNRAWNAQSTIILNRGGKLTVESGSYKHNGGTDMAITLDNSANSFGDAYMYIKGGEITSTYTAIRMRMENVALNGAGHGTSNLEITGGSIYGVKRGVWGHISSASTSPSLEIGALTVTGGTVEGGSNSIKMGEDSYNNMEVKVSGNAQIKGEVSGDTTDFAITGGTFTTNVSDYCADGFTVSDNGNGTFGVIENAEEVTITATSATLLYEDMIQIRYKYTVVGDGIVAYRMMIFASAEDALTRDPSKAIQIKDLIGYSDGYYYGYTDGIAAKEMGDSQFVVCYVELSDGTLVYADMIEYSPRIYAQNMIGKDSTSEETKALCHALMNYGAAAQIYFNYKTDALMNEGFDAVAFDESIMGEEIFSVDTTETNGFTTKSATLLYEGAITYRVKYDVSEEISGKALYVEYTMNGVTESVELKLEGGAYYGYISDVAAKDMDEKLVVKPYYVDENGDKVYGAELVYSGYEYARRTINNSTNENSVELAKAFASYVYAADKAIK
ncbi:MAG: hypothetical protein J6U86_05385 [Clostridia bacterium]|nr:hypothetical protein [Clostridia bacterium]